MEMLRRQSRLVLIVVSGLLIPIIIDMLSNWLQETVGRTPSQLIYLAAVLVGLALALYALALALRSRTEEVALVPRDARPPRCPGLIGLVGPGRPGDDPMKQAVLQALDYHLGAEGGLKVCWLIASSGEGGSVPIAEAICRAYQDRCTVVVRSVGDAFSVQDTYDVVQRIYNEEIFSPELADYKLSPNHVIADFTGGTRPMSAGMVLACGRYRSMEYMTGYKPGIRSVPLLVQFQPTRRRRS